MTARRFDPPPYPTMDELRESGRFEVVPVTVEGAADLAALHTIGTALEADRREAAVAAATEAGVGLRVDIHAWETHYWLDDEVAVGAIVERHLPGYATVEELRS